MSNQYKYDVFISWTGRDIILKNRLKKMLIDNGLLCYDSEEYCKGNFRIDFSSALLQSKVYLLILTDNLFNNPNESGKGYFTEVRRELDMAADLEARGLINFVIINVSKYFDFREIPDTSNQVAIYFYSYIAGFSTVRCTYANNSSEVLDEDILASVARAQSFIKERNNGHPVVSTKTKMPLIKNNIVPSEDFIGRVDDLNKINEAFLSGAQIVSLTGMGGIGKSELAKKYVSLVNGKYFFPQIITISDDETDRIGLKAIVFKAKFTEQYESESTRLSRDEQYEYKVKLLKELKDNVILLVDNYNFLSVDNIKAIIETLNCKVLLTTRISNLSIEDKSFGKLFKEINIDKLPVCDASQMFFNYYQLKKNEENVKNELFTTIYNLVNGHTMTLVIISKLMVKQDLTLNTMIEKLKNPELLDEKVSYIHNTYQENTTLFTHLYVLFDMSGLNTMAKNMEERYFNNVQKILRSLSLINVEGISEVVLKEVLHLSNSNEIIDLNDKGWLERTKVSHSPFEDSTYIIYIHPLISTLIIKELKPDLENSKEIINYVKKIMDIENDVDYTSLSKKKNLVSYLIDGLSKNEIYDNDLINKYIDILYRLGDIASAIRTITYLKNKLNDSNTNKELGIGDLALRSAYIKVLSMGDYNGAVNDSNEAISKLRFLDINKASNIAFMMANTSLIYGERDKAMFYSKLALDLSLETENILMILLAYTIDFQYLDKRNKKIYYKKINKKFKEITNKTKEYGVYYFVEFIIINLSHYDFSNGIYDGLKKTLDNIDDFDYDNKEVNRINKLLKEMNKHRNVDDPSVFLIDLLNSLLLDGTVDEDSVNMELQVFEYFKNKNKNKIFIDCKNELRINNAYLSLISSEKAIEMIDYNYNKLLLTSETIDLDTLNNWIIVGENLMKFGKYKEAINAYKKINQMQKYLLPNVHIDKGETFYNLGMCLKMVGQYDEARNCFYNSLGIYAKCLPISEMFIFATNDYLCTIRMLKNPRLELETASIFYSMAKEAITKLDIEKSYNSFIIDYNYALYLKCISDTKALKIFEHLWQNINKFDISISNKYYALEGYIDAEYFISRKVDINKVEQLYQIVLVIQDIKLTIKGLNYLGVSYYRNNQYDKSNEYFNNVLTIIITNNLENEVTYQIYLANYLSAYLHIISYNSVTNGALSFYLKIYNTYISRIIHIKFNTIEEINKTFDDEIKSWSFVYYSIHKIISYNNDEINSIVKDKLFNDYFLYLSNQYEENHEELYKVLLKSFMPISLSSEGYASKTFDLISQIICINYKKLIITVMNEYGEEFIAKLFREVTPMIISTMINDNYNCLLDLAFGLKNYLCEKDYLKYQDTVMLFLNKYLHVIVTNLSQFTKRQEVNNINLIYDIYRQDLKVILEISNVTFSIKIRRSKGNIILVASDESSYNEYLGEETKLILDKYNVTFDDEFMLLVTDTKNIKSNYNDLVNCLKEILAR